MEIQREEEKKEREAEKKDMESVLNLITELAVFEKEPDAVDITVDDLIKDLIKDLIEDCRDYAHREKCLPPSRSLHRWRRAAANT